MSRPEINVRKTRPSDGSLYERNEYIAYWVEDGDVEQFPDYLPDEINGVCGNTEQAAIDAANRHLDAKYPRS